MILVVLDAALEFDGLGVGVGVAVEVGVGLAVLVTVGVGDARFVELYCLIAIGT